MGVQASWWQTDIFVKEPGTGESSKTEHNGDSNATVTDLFQRPVLVHTQGRSCDYEVAGALRDTCERLRGTGFTQEDVISTMRNITGENGSRNVRRHVDNPKNEAGDTIFL